MPVIATPIITLDQAKALLKITADSFDTDLNGVIAAASQMIVNRVGSVAGSPSISEWHDGGSTDILLYNEGPIQSVTSVTESLGSVVYTLTQVTLDSGSVTTPFGYTVDLDQGLLVRRAAGVAVPFAGGEQNIHITFVSGYTTVPADITEACLELVKHLWEPRRGGANRPGGPPMETATYAMPHRVMEILSPYIVPGIA